MGLTPLVLFLYDRAFHQPQITDRLQAIDRPHDRITLNPSHRSAQLTGLGFDRLGVVGDRSYCIEF